MNVTHLYCVSSKLFNGGSSSHKTSTSVGVHDPGEPGGVPALRGGAVRVLRDPPGGGGENLFRGHI